jgi:hypothetical protein
MRKYVSVLILFLNVESGYSQNKTITDDTLKAKVLEQANLMVQALLKGNYQTFIKYTHPVIVDKLGGESQMVTVITNGVSKMKTEGMIIDNIVVDKPSIIVRSNDELQCTLQEHLTIVLANGKLVAISILIAISKDDGVNWWFLDTSDKELAAIKKILPNLNEAIVIPPKQKPILYSF